MEGHTAADLVLRKKDQVKTLGAKKSVKVDGCPMTIDPKLLFQRFITAVNSTYEDKKELFRCCVGSVCIVYMSVISSSMNVTLPCG